MGCDGLAFLISMIGPHARIVLLKSVAKSVKRKGGKYNDNKERSGIYDGTNISNCEHCRIRSTCKEYGGPASANTAGALARVSVIAYECMCCVVLCCGVCFALRISTTFID